MVGGTAGVINDMMKRYTGAFEIAEKARKTESFGKLLFSLTVAADSANWLAILTKDEYWHLKGILARSEVERAIGLVDRKQIALPESMTDEQLQLETIAAKELLQEQNSA